MQRSSLWLNFLPKIPSKHCRIDLSIFIIYLLDFIEWSRFAVADNPFSIPANSNEQTLNALIRSILKEDLNDKAQIDGIDSVEFDFYINGNYLDRILDAFVELHQEIKTVRSDFFKLKH
jgi:hypothetical protein